MKKIFQHIILVIAALSMITIACDDNIDPVITELVTERAFSPANLEARVSQDVNVRMLWDINPGISYYEVEFYTDTTNIIEENLYERVSEISPDNVPFTYEGLPGDTAIYARVKAISSYEGTDPSYWSSVIFETNAENIFTEPTLGGEEVTLFWSPGAKVSHIIITQGETDTKRELTDTEIEAGSAIITGLIFETDYTASIYNNDVKRGNIDFTTLPDGILLNSESDIEEALANAEDGEAFILEGGEYINAQGTITIDKNASFIALNPDDRPLLKVQFVIADGATNTVLLSGIDFEATYTDEEGDQQLDHGVQIKPSQDGAILGDIIIENCTFTGHKKSLLAAGSGSFSAESITINNCVVTDLNSNGGDFIDFRKSFVKTLTITNNTFDNCAYNAQVKAREFVRFDGASKGNAYDDGVNTPTIIVKYNTLYQCSIFNDEKAGRLFYVRWENTQEVIECQNNIFSDMNMVDYYIGFDDASLSLKDNFYYNSASLLSDDGAGTDENPGFADADGGDFTISNQNIVDLNVGDPRWR
nr:DUF5123 domain-containing protein [uncultured Carboxylicivirga sp.]